MEIEGVYADKSAKNKFTKNLFPLKWLLQFSTMK